MDVADLARGVIAGDRRALSRAITRVESGRADHRPQAAELMSLTAATGRQALRIGLSGAPGVGKSTFIESFGLMLTGQGLRVAVLAVDPSSRHSGGSILGDKTRMEHLARDPRAFIRPSPSQAHLGGVARRSREAVALCEAAGFDVVLIETVGVGQSEVLVADLCDIFVLLIAPAGGDELQGVKRGIVEIADLILVNKADGALLSTALATTSDYSGALRLLRRRPQDPSGFPLAMPVSALAATGLAEAWARMQELAGFRRDAGHWQENRARQLRQAFQTELRHGLLAILETPAVRQEAARLGEAVAQGLSTPETAAAELLARLPALSSVRKYPAGGPGGAKPPGASSEYPTDPA